MIALNKKINSLFLVLGLIFLIITPLGIAGIPNRMETAKLDKIDKDNRNPFGCRDSGYRFDLKTLSFLPSTKTDHQSLYLIYNYSHQNINLYQMLQKESSRSLYLNHTISAGFWSAFATSERPVNYLCTLSTSTSHYGEIVDCSQYLRVCEYVNVKFGLNNRGNFWIVDSSTRNGAVKGVVHYGIIPDYQVSDKTKKDKKAKKYSKR